MISTFIKNISTFLLNKISRRNYLILACILTGLVAGMAAVVLKTMVHWVEAQAPKVLEHNRLNYFWLFLTPVIGILLAVFFEKRFLRGKLIKGVSKILFAITRKQGNLDRRDTYAHLVTSALTIGMGGSAGLEAPIVVTGSAIGSNLAAQLHLGYKEKTLLLACGASAGIAAVFNAPIAGVIFAAEVLLTEITISAFVPLLISAAVASVLSQFFFQDRLFVPLEGEWRLKSIPFYFLLGIVCGLVSVYMCRTTFFLEKKLAKLRARYSKALLGGALLGLMIVLFPPLYGEGYTVIQKLLQGQEVNLLRLSLFDNEANAHLSLLLFLGAIVFLKVIATSLTIGSGGNGGIFASSLFTGAIVGFLYARLINISGILKVAEVNYVAAGMAGVIAGVIHAPLTGIFLIAEVTGGYYLFVPLMIVAAMSYFIARYFDKASVYTRPLIEAGVHFQDDRDTFLLNSIQLRDLLETDMEVVGENISLRLVIEQFIRSKQNIFPVVDDQMRLTGIILLEDLKDYLFDAEKAERILAKDVADPPPDIIQSSEKMPSVMQKFDATGVWKLPVVNERGVLMGFVSKKRIFTKYRELLKMYSKADVIS